MKRFIRKVNGERVLGREECVDCPWGNGMGGCTIPGYCPDREVEDED